MIAASAPIGRVFRSAVSVIATRRPLRSYHGPSPMRSFACTGPSLLPPLAVLKNARQPFAPAPGIDFSARSVQILSAPASPVACPYRRSPPNPCSFFDSSRIPPRLVTKKLNFSVGTGAEPPAPPLPAAGAPAPPPVPAGLPLRPAAGAPPVPALGPAVPAAALPPPVPPLPPAPAPAAFAGEAVVPAPIPTAIIPAVPPPPAPASCSAPVPAVSAAGSGESEPQPTPTKTPRMRHTAARIHTLLANIGPGLSLKSVV